MNELQRQHQAHLERLGRLAAAANAHAARREVPPAPVVEPEQTEKPAAKMLTFSEAKRVDPFEIRKFPRVKEIQAAVCRVFNVSFCDITSPRRLSVMVTARQVGMYLCRMLTPHSYPEIGRRFGGRDHTTVLHAIRKIKERCEADPEFAERVEALARSLAPKPDSEAAE